MDFQLPVTLRVNGADHPLALEPRRTLLDALRCDLQLTGTKKVCDMGDCGDCTVLVHGRAMYACLLLAVDCEGPGASRAYRPLSPAGIGGRHWGTSQQEAGGSANDTMEA